MARVLQPVVDEVLLPLDGPGSDTELRSVRQAGVRTRSLIVAGATTGLLACAALGSALLRGAGPARLRGQSTQQLQEVGYVTAPTSMEKGATFAIPSSPQDVNTYFNLMMGQGPPRPGPDAGCHMDEEVFQGLCYKKCSSLTNGTHPLRTSAWTCCSASEVKDCFIKNQMHDLGFCSGFDVGGDGHCPHPPGNCDNDAELYMGTCFPKCAILTNGTKPYRNSPFTCCDSPSFMSCLSPSRFDASASFLTGAQAPHGSVMEQLATTPPPVVYR